MNDIRIKGKISKSGNSYHIFIPRALVECGVLKKGEEIEFRIVPKSETENLKSETNSSTDCELASFLILCEDQKFKKLDDKLKL